MVVSHEASDRASGARSRAGTSSGSGSGDIGRRLALQRERLGLTREEVAARAGMAPGYLTYLEEEPADPRGPGLLRLAGALETTVDRLRGGGTGPPGRGRPEPHPELHDLDAAECRDRLSTHGVGRIAVSTPKGPAIVPVNYRVEGGAIAYRATPGTEPAAAPGHEVAFEVDHVDEALSQGWSVLVVGEARAVTAAEAARLDEHAPAEPWAGGERQVWVLIEPERVTGRRIHIG